MIPLYNILVRNQHDSKKTKDDDVSWADLFMHHFLIGIYTICTFRDIFKGKKKKKKKGVQRTLRKNGPRSSAVAVFSSSLAVT